MTESVKIAEVTINAPVTIDAKPTIDPGNVAAIMLAIGSCLAVGGVYILAGTGWAMLTASVPFVAVSAVLIRGLTRAG